MSTNTGAGTTPAAEKNQNAGGQTPPATPPATVQKSHGERFTEMVVAQLTGLAPGAQISEFQKRLAQNYFIKLDTTLKDLEKKRLGKAEQYREAIPYTWQYVNTQKFALDVVAYSMVGLDPMQPNHINLIPYANNSSGVYDIGCIPGYRGIEIKARKYGLDVPDEVIVELVYSTDKFRQIKKDKDNAIEQYEFEVVNDFNRGDIIGGFFYYKYFNKPEKNRIRVMNMADINKRRPKHGGSDFWGGEKDKWVTNAQGQREKVKETIEGWFPEMVFKTLYRAAYNGITIDSNKIDEAFRHLLVLEAELRDEGIQKEIDANANKINITLTDQEDGQEPTPPATEEANAEVIPTPAATHTATPIVTPPASTPAPAAEAATNGTLFDNDKKDGDAPF